MNFDNIYISKSIDISSSTILGTSYIYFEKNNNYIKLNQTGSFIWKNINEENSVKNLFDICCSQFTNEKAEIESYINTFLEELYHIGAISFSNDKYKDIINDVP